MTPATHTRRAGVVLMAYSHRCSDTGPLQPAATYREQNLVNEHAFFKLARGVDEPPASSSQSAVDGMACDLTRWDCECIQLIANVEVVRMVRSSGGDRRAKGR